MTPMTLKIVVISISMVDLILIIAGELKGWLEILRRRFEIFRRT